MSCNIGENIVLKPHNSEVAVLFVTGKRIKRIEKIVVKREDIEKFIDEWQKYYSLKKP